MPSRFWDESRIELEEVPCEHTKVEGTGTHRKDCKQYHLSQECDWRESLAIKLVRKTKISSRLETYESNKI